MPPSPRSNQGKPGSGRRQRYFSWLRLILGLVLAVGIVQIKLDFFEYYLYDLHFRSRPSPTPSGHVTLLLMDKTTVEELKGIPDYQAHTRILEKLIAKKPKAIVFVTPIAPMDNSVFELDRAQGSPHGENKDLQTFLNTVLSYDSVFQITDQMALKGEENKLVLPAPFEKIKVLSGPKTKDGETFAKDSVTRRVMLDYEGATLAHLKLAQLIQPELDHTMAIRGVFDVYGTRQVYIDFGRPGSIAAIKFEDLLSGRATLPDLDDQIVLIGDNFEKSLRNTIKTPFDRDPSAMTYLDMHANMLETFLRNSAPVQAPEWLDLILTALISMMTIRAVLTMRPTRGLVALLSSAAAVSFLSFVVFYFGLWVPLAHPILAIFVCYYFFIPYRLIIENRRSWEYYQKHQLLQQVEQLKTNFISMMSHDLKTPIARIQGMTDVILKDAVVLSAGQREAVDHIRQSGDDLLRFINAILNYARIESEGVQLHTESRDVNELLQNVIRKNEFLARVKNIELIAELEPLFSIKLDPELMKQVFSNLVENAIKYSPDDSKILISSEERDGWVVIQVADQGPGIPADELSNVFDKFFRSRNAKASPIKGSGLGLYLAKYFVELHHGRLTAESQVNQGSTFTVELPISST